MALTAKRLAGWNPSAITLEEAELVHGRKPNWRHMAAAIAGAPGEPGTLNPFHLAVGLWLCERER